MCTKFDWSEDFIIDCEFSTMCLKTISTLHLQNEKQNAIIRGCAPQKDTKQVCYTYLTYTYLTELLIQRHIFLNLLLPDFIFSNRNKLAIQLLPE